MIAAISWSGGKDGWLALLHARAGGLDVRYAITMLDESGERSRSHALPPDLIARQASALGLESVTARAAWQDYETSLIVALQSLAGRGVTAMVFGDIDIASHRAFEEKVCAAAGLSAVLPLWQQDRGALLDDMFARGLEAIVVTTDNRFLDAHYCGRRFDRAFVASLPPGVDACGENGEFHTFVTGGEGFAAALPVVQAPSYAHAVSFAGSQAGYHVTPLQIEAA